VLHGVCNARIPPSDAKPASAIAVGWLRVAQPAGGYASRGQARPDCDTQDRRNRGKPARFKKLCFPVAKKGPPRLSASLAVEPEFCLKPSGQHDLRTASCTANLAVELAVPCEWQTANAGFAPERCVHRQPTNVAGNSRHVVLLPLKKQEIAGPACFATLKGSALAWSCAFLGR
jgi:hypothetical protein